MKIKFLGTAASEGTPAMFCGCRICKFAVKNGGKNVRTRSQALVNDDLLIDYPADTYLHTLYHGLDMHIVKNIIITHSHSDHFYPEDLDHNKFPGAINDKYNLLNVFGNDSVIDMAEKFFGDGKHNNLKFNRVHAFELFETGNYEITPLPAVHDRSEECLIYIVRDKITGKYLLYGNDTGFFTEECMKYIKGMKFDLISLDCTQGKHRDGNNHMGYEDVTEMFECLENNGNIDIQTIKAAQHFSHFGDILYDEYLSIFGNSGIVTAYDGLEISVD